MSNPEGSVTVTDVHEVLGAPVRYCPSCGTSLERPAGFVHEYWVTEDRLFHCWCPECYFLCTVVLSSQIASHEPEH